MWLHEAFKHFENFTLVKTTNINLDQKWTHVNVNVLTKYIINRKKIKFRVSSKRAQKLC